MKKTKIDFSDHDEAERQIRKAIKNGEKPMDLSIQKWEYVIKSKDWDAGEGGTNCALCISADYECGECPLGKTKDNCYDDEGPYTLFMVAYWNKDEKLTMKYAKKMLKVLKRIKKKMEKER